MNRITPPPFPSMAAFWNQKPLLAAKQLSLALQGEMMALPTPHVPTEDTPSTEPGHLIDVIV